MAEFTLNNDSKKALQLDDNGDVIAIESLTSELKKCAMQFLSILFSFGRYSYLPCPKEREPLNYALFLSYFFDFYSNEYCKDSCNHKHVNNLFEKYPDIYAVVDAIIDNVKELIRPAIFTMLRQKEFRKSLGF